MKQPFAPRNQVPYIVWHDSLIAAITASVPGVKPADITAMTTDNSNMHTKLAAILPADNTSKAVHNALNMSIAKSRKQVTAMVKNIKNDPAYTPDLGKTLGIEGAEDTTDMTQAQPTLVVKTRSNGVTEVHFDKMLAEGVHLRCQRDGDAGLAFLASETHSPYVDNRPLLVAGKPETRRYDGTFFQNKAEIGNPSAVVTAIAQP